MQLMAKILCIFVSWENSQSGIKYLHVGQRSRGDIVRTRIRSGAAFYPASAGRALKCTDSQHKKLSADPQARMERRESEEAVQLLEEMAARDCSGLTDPAFRLVSDQHWGRYAVAARDLKPGDVILLEQPLVQKTVIFFHLVANTGREVRFRPHLSASICSLTVQCPRW